MIHSSAIIDPTAKIGRDVTIGPWTLIGPNVSIGDGTWIGPHVVIQGPTIIGKENKIFQFCSLGEVPQDKKFQGEDATLVIGDRNVIRESCTFNRGTSYRMETRIGNDNLFMAYVHIAHDCVVGNHTIFANNATLAGHVVVDDFAILGGFSGVAQFCRVGSYSFAAGGSMIDKDVPPFLRVSGYYAKPIGLNTVGLQRHGFTSEILLTIRRAYKTLYRQGLTVKQALEVLTPMAVDCTQVKTLIDFIHASERGIVR